MLKVNKKKTGVTADGLKSNIIYLTGLLNVERGVAFEQAQEVIDLYTNRDEPDLAQSLATLFNAAMREEAHKDTPYITDQHLSPAERVVMLILHVQDKGSVIPQSEIARLAGVSLVSLKRHLKALRQKGYIRTDTDRSGTDYTILK